jgi:cellulose synthase/poly-beta-1,6-N-acetylglucosamine synthase-like glycosyltransferase
MSGIIFWSAVAFVAYVYAGYPILIALGARLRSERTVDPGHTPALTVVIAAYDEEDYIEAKLAETLALDYPADRLQVIVAADGSADGTAALARRFAGVLVLHRPERLGKMAALERAVDHASGEVIVFSDANNSYAPGALRAMAAPFCDPAVGVVVGRKTVHGDDALGYSEGLYWRYEAAIRRWETRFGSCTGVNGEIIAVRRALFSPAPPGTINDDAWLGQRALRLGFRVAYAHDAVSSEPVSATARDEMDRRTRMVAGQFQQLFALRDLPWRRPVAMWQLASHKLARPLVPFAMLTALAASIAALAAPGSGGGPGAVLTLAPPWNWVAVSSQALFYALALAGRRLDGIAGKIAYLPRFLVDSNAAALRGFVRYLKGGQSAAWDKVARRPSAGSRR